MRYLINRSDAIGDLMLTLPMVHALKQQNPKLQVALLVSNRNLAVLEHHPLLDEVFCLDRNQPLAQQLKSLWQFFKRFRPDVFLHVGGSGLPAMVSFFRRIPVRAGLRNKWYTFLWLNKGKRQQRSQALTHEAQYNLNLLSDFLSQYDWQKHPTKKSNDPNLAPKIYLTQAERDDFNQRWVRALTNHDPKINRSQFKGYIVIHPGMTGHTLNWPPAFYAQWMWQLHQHYAGRFLFVLSHTPSDRPYVDAFKAELYKLDPAKSAPLWEFQGIEWGMRSFMVLLEQAHLFIGPSTGPTHLANALGTTQIAIYSPVKVQAAKRWGPYRQDARVVVLSPQVECPGHFDCLLEKCQYYPCMPTVTVQQAFEQACQLLGKI